MLEKYILMNQNTKVLKFEFDKDLNVITKIDEIYNLDYAPLNIKNKIEERRTIELNNWFNDRASEEKIKKLKELSTIYEEMLVKYQDYTKLSNEEIGKLVEGYKTRIEIFEKIVNK